MLTLVLFLSGLAACGPTKPFSEIASEVVIAQHSDAYTHPWVNSARHKSPSMRWYLMEQKYGTSGKYAFEAPKGWLVRDNPGEWGMDLYLDYMMTGRMDNLLQVVAIDLETSAGCSLKTMDSARGVSSADELSIVLEVLDRYSEEKSHQLLRQKTEGLTGIREAMWQSQGQAKYWINRVSYDNGRMLIIECGAAEPWSNHHAIDEMEGGLIQGFLNKTENSNSSKDAS